EPHWTTIRVGQSLTWHSDLKTTVTIHVPPGAFDQTEFVVPAHGTVHSGPAQNPGDHNMWSTPGACQAAPLGVQGAGPGVTAEEKTKALDLALQQIEKQFGKGAIMKLGEESAKVGVDVIHTGSLGLDLATGVGGVPRGRIVEIYGPESSGKTTLALTIIANAQ